MTEDIQLRAWNNHRLKWCVVEMVWSFDEQTGRMIFYPMPAPEASDYIDIEFYTRLNDAGGLKIFEGDILGLQDSDDNSRCVVEMQDGAYRKKFDWGYATSSLTQDEINLMGWIVIGNKHENTDMLKEEQT